MDRRLRLVVPLFDERAQRRIIPLRDTRSVATVQALDWPGLLLEAGRNDVVEVDDLTLGHHYFGVNADREPVTMEVKGPHGYRAVTLPPGAGWLSPAGDPFSLRVRDAGTHAYVRFSIEPQRFERLVSVEADGGKPIELRRTFHLGGPQLQHLVGALTAEASDGTPSGLVFVETITAALGLQLVQQAGVVVPRPEPVRGGLAPGVKRRVLDLMHAQPEERLTIEALAREAGLSPAHFARAFHDSVGMAPHQYLVQLRLERARRLLDAPGAVLADVALRSGFADQAHFTRFFKRRFGVTPGAVVRARQR